MGFLNRLPARQDAYYSRNRMWKNKGSDTAANRRTLVSPSHMLIKQLLLLVISLLNLIGLMLLLLVLNLKVSVLIEILL